MRIYWTGDIFITSEVCVSDKSITNLPRKWYPRLRKFAACIYTCYYRLNIFSQFRQYKINNYLLCQLSDVINLLFEKKKFDEIINIFYISIIKDYSLLLNASSEADFWTSF